MGEGEELERRTVVGIPTPKKCSQCQNTVDPGFELIRVADVIDNLTGIDAQDYIYRCLNCGQTMHCGTLMQTPGRSYDDEPEE
jgi:hypothetical protein